MGSRLEAFQHPAPFDSQPAGRGGSLRYTGFDRLLDLEGEEETGAIISL